MALLELPDRDTSNVSRKIPTTIYLSLHHTCATQTLNRITWTNPLKKRF